jgi:site-specific DNA-methyltransferase (adenine-specific)
MQPYYEASGITLYHADYRDVLSEIPKVDAVITDPPFSEHTHGNAKSNRNLGYGNKAIDFKAIDFKAIDFKAIDFKAIEDLLRSVGPLCSRWFIATMDWRHIAQIERTPPIPWEFVRFGVWVKTNPMPQISADRPANGWDGIAYLHNLNTRKRWNGGGNHGNYIDHVVTNGDHPTGKPLEMLFSFVERFTDPGDLILDPYCGSGTTLVAAKLLGRRAIGVELDEGYCQVTVDRLRQEILPLSIPEPQPEQMRLL